MELIYNNKTYLLQNEVGGFSDYGVSFGRDSGKTGISRSYILNLQFSNEDADYIKEILYNDGYNSQISLMFEGQMYILDLLTIEIDDVFINISAKKGGIFNAIDNKWSDNVDFGLQRRASETLNYTGNEVNFAVTWKSNDIAITRISNSQFNPIQLQENNLNISDIGKFQNTSQVIGTTIGKDQCFVIDQLSSGQLSCDYNMQNIVVDPIYMGQGIPTQVRCSFYFNIRIFKKTIDESWNINGANLIHHFQTSKELIYSVEYTRKQTTVLETIMTCKQINIQGPTIIDLSFINEEYYIAFDYKLQEVYIDISGATVNLPNETWKISVYDSQYYGIDKTRFSFTNGLSITFNVQNFVLNSNISLSCYKLSDVASVLLKNINTDNLPIDLTELKKYDLIKLFNGLMLKKIGSFKTNLADFTEFVYLVTGLRLCIDDKIYFRTFDQCFDNVSNGQIENVKDMKIIPAEFIYTHIQIGYENDESIFGAYEFNTLNTFKTENTNLAEKTLVLSTKYKVGAFDVDTYIFNYLNADKNSDSGQENIYVYYSGERVAGSGNIIKAINTQFSPKRLINIHSKELSCYAKTLNFHETKGLADIIFNSINEKANVTLPVAFLKPFILTFSGIYDILTINPYGYFEIFYNGKWIKCYLSENEEAASIKPFQGAVSEFRTYIKNDVNLL